VQEQYLGSAVVHARENDLDTSHFGASLEPIHGVERTRVLDRHVGLSLKDPTFRHPPTQGIKCDVCGHCGGPRSKVAPALQWLSGQRRDDALEGGLDQVIVVGTGRAQDAPKSAIDDRMDATVELVCSPFFAGSNALDDLPICDLELGHGARLGQATSGEVRF
jgi:hypothetical protein